MKEIKILYDWGYDYNLFFAVESIVGENVNKVERKFDVKLKIELCEGLEVIGKIKTEKYDFVVIHLGHGKGYELYLRGRRAKEISPWVVTVGESSDPVYGVEEIEKFFDCYSGYPIYDRRVGAYSLERLLGKYILTEESL